MMAAMILPGAAPQLEIQTTSKPPAFGPIGMEQYGTERAQPVANVCLGERRKVALLAPNVCQRLPAIDVSIAW